MGIKMNITGKNGQPKLVDINRRKAARLKCYDCSAFNWAEVDRCVLTDCSLFPYRQGKCPGSSAKRNASIRAHCLWCCAGSTNEVSKCPTSDCSLWPFRQTKVDRSCEVKEAERRETAEVGSDNL